MPEPRRLRSMAGAPAGPAGARDEDELPTQPGWERLARIVRNAPVALVEVDAHQRVLTWNLAAESLFGWRASEVVGGPNPLIPDDPGPDPGAVPRQGSPALDQSLQEQRARAGEAAVGHRYEARRLHKDGHLVDVEVLLSAVTDGAGRVTSWIAAFTDHSERTMLRAGLDARMRQQAAVAALGQTALGAHTLEPVIDAAIAAVVSTLDLVAAAAVRREPDGALRFVATRGYAIPEDRHTYADAEARDGLPLAWQVVTSGTPIVLDDIEAPDVPLPAWAVRLLRDTGVRSTACVPIGGLAAPWGAVSAHSGRAGSFTGDDLVFLHSVANVVAEAAARCEIEAEVRHRATHDALTGLPNRETLGERLAEVLAAPRSARDEGTCALLLIDLDGFKDVNDSQGHQVGDAVLRQVATRLRGRMRSSDMVARLGGDEFAVVLRRLPGPEHATWVAADLGSLLRLPFTSPAGPIGLAGSIGIAISAPGGCDPFELLRRADTAMYRAKRERCGHAVHDPRTDDGTTSRLSLVSDLRAALEDDALTVHYQPVVDLGTRDVTGVEALVRWTHPTLGPQSPGDFVALAESSGLAGDLTDLVLRHTTRQWVRWTRDGFRVPIAVNLPPMLLRDDGYAGYFLRSVAASGMPVEMLRVEVTESALAHDAAVDVLRELRGRGIRVAIDDFGTGWSSLGRLKQLPVDTIKIDRSFVTGLVDDRRDAAIVRSVVALAEELGLRTIAEGVETAAVEAALADLGVDRAQGYLYARPLPAAELRTWYTAWRADHPVPPPGPSLTPG
ncbi:EAL domain-containing protein [Kineosporia sp. R_H_3]|uniref:sensor domain-containing protein n=1 Tax=Kineosporia sp. R_H_3 TaxID=1961848 RepID=UPI00117B39B6|nr:EAL domain-containing protein [Kineosporia sp. R_H_3]